MLVALTLVVLTAGAPADASELLRLSDESRNGWPSFVVTIKITTLESGKPDEERAYRVYQKGTDKTYVEFLSPREKGRHLLMLGDDMWIYLPDTSRPLRITPLERLSGNAANGDVARTSYASDYTATYLRNEDVEGVRSHVLELVAKRKGSTYKLIHYWLRAVDALPIKADFFLGSGKLVKSASFDEYREIEGRVLLHRMTIRDQLRKSAVSVLEYTSYEPKRLPDRMFYQGRAEIF